jgi:hypothetical protein
MYRKIINQIVKIIMFVTNPKNDKPPTPIFTRSMVCVKGDKKAAYTPRVGIFSKGINSPLINMRGILTKFKGIMTSPG